ncbi:hypothetical protein J2799_003673 [Chryseobacterium vietnamense]|nr:hypothetical protein [Chryseobacterium vietnamense]
MVGTLAGILSVVCTGCGNACVEEYSYPKYTL